MKAPGECPLAEAGGICVVRQCEWCEEKEQGSKPQLHEPWGVGGVAGVGKRPVSERHMPNFVSGTCEKGRSNEAEEQEEAGRALTLAECVRG